MRELLETPDRNIVLVQSGADALREVLKTDFALILLDIRMPAMDGFETAGMIRRYHRSRQTPMIFLTAAYDDDQSRLRAYGMGGADFIAKPVNPEVLQSKVAVFVDVYRKGAHLRADVQRRGLNRAGSVPTRHSEARSGNAPASPLVANDLLRSVIAMRERRGRAAAAKQHADRERRQITWPT
jgi:CheY-like chemotaxis protein